MRTASFITILGLFLLVLSCGNQSISFTGSPDDDNVSDDDDDDNDDYLDDDDNDVSDDDDDYLDDDDNNVSDDDDDDDEDEWIISPFATSWLERACPQDDDTCPAGMDYSPSWDRCETASCVVNAQCANGGTCNTARRRCPPVSCDEGLHVCKSCESCRLDTLSCEPDLDLPSCYPDPNRMETCPVEAGTQEHLVLSSEALVFNEGDELQVQTVWVCNAGAQGHAISLSSLKKSYGFNEEEFMVLALDMPFSLPLGGKIPIHVAYTPKDLRAGQSTLTLKSDAPNQTSLRISLRENFARRAVFESCPRVVHFQGTGVKDVVLVNVGTARGDVDYPTFSWSRTPHLTVESCRINGTRDLVSPDFLDRGSYLSCRIRYDGTPLEMDMDELRWNVDAPKISVRTEPDSDHFCRGDLPPRCNDRNQVVVCRPDEGGYWVWTLSHACAENETCVNAQCKESCTLETGCNDRNQYCLDADGDGQGFCEPFCDVSAESCPNGMVCSIDHRRCLPICPTCTEGLCCDRTGQADCHACECVNPDICALSSPPCCPGFHCSFSTMGMIGTCLEDP